MATGAIMPTFYRNFPPANFLQQCRLPDFPQLVDNAFKVMDGLPQSTTELMVTIAQVMLRPADETASGTLKVFLAVKDPVQHSIRVVALIGLAERISQLAGLSPKTTTPVKELACQAIIATTVDQHDASNPNPTAAKIVINIPEEFMRQLIAGNHQLNRALFPPPCSATAETEWN
ncbi:MAG: hypothetical protein AAB833_01800 [Patescibacteria group bacterium]